MKPPPSVGMELTTTIQGIVLVFDATNQDTFDSLSGWKDFVNEKNPSVMLCMANKIDLLDKIDFESQREIWLSWCLDAGFELIQCSAVRDKLEGKNPISSLNRVVRSVSYSGIFVFVALNISGNREAEGVERLIEAIGSHTWASMQVESARHLCRRHMLAPQTLIAALRR
jgi:hypothetical protein